MDESMAEEAEDHIEDVDDELPPDESGAQSESGSEDEQTSTQAPSVEDLALGLGWKPEDQWKGDKSHWTPADEFIRQKVNKGERLYEEVRSLKDTTQRLARTSAAIAERNIRQALDDAQSRFEQAVEEKDARAAYEASEEMRRLNEQRNEPQEAPELADFKARNGWYGKDEAATEYAHSVALRLAKQGKSNPEQLAQAEREVRQRFPELFDDAPEPRREREPVKRGPALNAPTSRTARPTPRAKGANDLPPEARAAGMDFVKRGRVKSLDDYAKIYFEEEDA